MRLILISIASWLVGSLALVLGFSFAQGNRGLQPGTSVVASLLATALCYSLAYGPSLTWLKTRFGEGERTLILTLTSSLILNFPIFLVSLLAIGRTLPAAEAYAVMISFAVMGATFGRGFVWNSQRQKRIKESRTQLRMITGKHALIH